MRLLRVVVVSSYETPLESFFFPLPSGASFFCQTSIPLSGPIPSPPLPRRRFFGGDWIFPATSSSTPFSDVFPPESSSFYFPPFRGTDRLVDTLSCSLSLLILKPKTRHPARGRFSTETPPMLPMVVPSRLTGSPPPPPSISIPPFFCSTPIELKESDEVEVFFFVVYSFLLTSGRSQAPVLYFTDPSLHLVRERMPV